MVGTVVMGESVGAVCLGMRGPGWAAWCCAGADVVVRPVPLLTGLAPLLGARLAWP